MGTLDRLWEERAGEFAGTAMRYLRLVANSGFMFSIYALFLVGGFMYPAFLEWLPAYVPVLELFTLLFTYFLTRNPIRTFLKEADMVFLLPVENQLRSYFRKSVVYSYTLQSLFIVLLYFILGPLYQNRLFEESNSFLLVLVIILAVKGWNIASAWAEWRLQDHRVRFGLLAGRVILTASLLYIVFADASWLMTVILLAVMAGVYAFWHGRLAKKYALKWEAVFLMEQRRLSSFYRFIQSFADVPFIKSPVKRRRWLSGLAERMPFQKDKAYRYMYVKAFVRSGEYLGMYARLLLVGCLVMYAFPFEWLRVLVSVLFVYLTGVQLRTLWYHFDTNIWPDLYPLALSEKEYSFQFLVLRLLMLQSVLFAGAYLLLGTYMLFSLFILGAGLLLSYYLSRQKPKSRLELS